MKQRFTGILLVCCVLSYANIAGAQEMKEGADLMFPSTEEEIVKALGTMPDDSPRPGNGALTSGGNTKSLFGGTGKTRGLQSIIDDNDEDALAQAPKAMALILFDYDSAVIQPESLPLLRLYGNALQDKLRDATLLVAGHTDSSGDADYNYSLSRRRAEAVKRFLVTECRVEADRLTVKPYGERKPIASNASNEGRRKNRRVEFIRIP